MTDSIQELLDAGEPVVMPPWDLTVDRPLLLRRENGGQLRGDPSGRTRLFGDFGSGPLVLVQPARPFTFSAYKPMLLLAGEPSLYYPVPQTLRVSYTLTRAAEASQNNAAVHLHCGCDYGVTRHVAWGVWDYFGALRLWWDDVSHDAPGAAQAAGPTYRVDLTYDGATVVLAVDGKEVLSFPFSGPVPQWPMGVDAVALGYDCSGPHGVLQSHGPPEATFGDLWINGFHLDLIANDGTFLIGTRPDGKLAYVLPNSVETQGGNFCVSDITFMGQAGASGILLYDAIASRVERVGFVQSWHGFETRGTTYAGNFTRLTGTCLSVAWLQTGQSMATYAADLNVSAAGISMLVAGPVGGSYTKVYAAPLGGSTFALYVRETQDLNVYGGQIDDEGQAGPVRGVVVADAAAVKLSGVQLARQSPGAVVSLARGGSALLSGCWLAPVDGSPSHLAFPAGPADLPTQPVTLVGCRVNPKVPLSDSPLASVASVGTLAPVTDPPPPPPVS